jgi:hypothetical protein
MLTFVIALAAMLLVGIPLITRSVHLPAVMEFKEVAESEWSDKQRVFFDEHDVQLRTLGFTPVTTFAVVNMQNPNLTRYYQSELDNAVAFLTAITAANGQAFQHYLEFVQEFADGTQLTTKNATLTSVFPRMPMRFLQDMPGAAPAALKAAHERWVARERKLAAGRVRRDELFARAAAKHTEWLTFLETGGYLRRDPVQPIFRATTKTALRGVANFVNPLADNFTVPRLAAGLALGASLPLAVNLYESDLLMKLVPYVPMEYAPGVLYGVAYGLAGAAVGRIFTAKAFLWAFLLSALPVSLATGGRADHFAAEIWMASLAHYVSTRHAKRMAIVEPLSPAPPNPREPGEAAEREDAGGPPQVR